MKILVAPDKFKECLTAAEAGALLADAARAVFPHAEITTLPLSDGGDGFAETLVAAAGGEWVELTATAAYGERRAGRFGWVDAAKLPAAVAAMLDIRAHGKIAVADAASVCGLAQTDAAQRDPVRASSRGVGELIAKATEKNAAAILLGLGGVATNDLGLGALEAVGLELHSPETGKIRASTPADWGRDTRVSGFLWPNVPDLRLACDVTNPLLGPNGATYAFGPQKGLSSEGVNELERRAGVMAKKLCDFCEKPRTLMAEPGAGAAGGIAFGLRCALDAKTVPGAALVAAWTDLDARIRSADLVITGEGAFDLGSLAGKLPGHVAELAAKHRKPLLVVAGRVDATAAAALAARGRHLRAVSASHDDWTPAQRRAHAREALALAVATGVAAMR